VATGTCKLVVDGGKFEGFSLALETDKAPAYGVLSGPIELLKAAHRAGWVKVELSEGTLIDIGIVQVSNKRRPPEKSRTFPSNTTSRECQTPNLIIRLTCSGLHPALQCHPSMMLWNL
jgi:hypothetical protein